jgi:hypothetical protein
LTAAPTPAKQTTSIINVKPTGKPVAAKSVGIVAAPAAEKALASPPKK